MANSTVDFIPKHYNKKRLIQALGSDAEKFIARSDYFDSLWQSWRDCSVRTRSTVDLIRSMGVEEADDEFSSIQSVMAGLGYDQGLDYQHRGREIRFSSPEIKVAFLLMFGHIIQ